MSNSNGESLSRSSGKIGLATAGSRVTGLLRETVFAYLLGSGMAADAFFAATRIPNLLRDLFAEGALGAAFVPVISGRLSRGERESAFALVQRMATALSLIVGLVVALGIVLAPFLVGALVPGFREIPGKYETTTFLVHWTFPYLWLISLSALVGGTLNALHRFGVPASAPIVFNIAHIAVALGFYTVFDPPVLALAVGMIVGAAAQFLVQLPALKATGFRFRLRWPWGDPDVARVFRLVLPVTLGLAALQLNNLATTLIASLLPQGSISYLNYAFRLMHFPLGVFAVAVGTAVLPRASAAVTQNNREHLQRIFDEGATLATFLVLPASVFLVLFADLVVAPAYQRGAFSPADTAATASALRFYAMGLVGYTGVRVAAPMFYAHKDTRTPMRMAMVAVAVNVILNVALAFPMGFAGLALANAVAGTANFALLWRKMVHAHGIAPGRDARSDIARLALDTAIAGAVTYGLWRLWGVDPSKCGLGLQLSALGGMAVVFLGLYMMRAFRASSPQRRLMGRLLGS